MPIQQLELTKRAALIRIPTGAPADHPAIERTAAIADSGEYVLEQATEAIREAGRDRRLTPEGRADKRKELARTAVDALRRVQRKAPTREDLAEVEARKLDAKRLLGYPGGRTEIHAEQEAETRTELLRIKREEGPEVLARTLEKAATDGDRVTLRAALHAPPLLRLVEVDQAPALMESLFEATDPDGHADLQALRGAVSATEFNVERILETLRKLAGDPMLGRDDPAA